MLPEIKQFQVVALLQDLPEHSLKAGVRGTVLEELNEPHHAYEVEFTDGEGRTVALVHLKPNQIVAVD